MHLNLKHFDATLDDPAAHSQLWIRVICSLTLLIPLASTAVMRKKIRQTSDKYYLPTTPPDCFFKIWIIMFLLLIVIMIYAAIQDCWSADIWIYLAVINLSCGVWSFTFNSGVLFWVNVSILCQFVNLAAIQMVWIQLKNHQKNTLVDSLIGVLIRNSFAFLQGWFIAAAALGLFILLVYTFGLSLKRQVILFWIAAPLVYLAFLFYNIKVIGTFKETIGLLVSMAWAVSGAAIASIQSDPTRQAKQIE